MQTQTSYTLHNAIIEAGGKDHLPMLAPDKEIPVTKGSSVTTTERYMENYKNVSQDIRDQLNAEAEAVQIILTGIDNDIYSTVDACPIACEMWKAIERFVTLVKQSQELKTVSYHKLYDILKQHQNEVNELRAERLARTANPLALVAQQQPVYHPQNHHTHYTQNSSTRSQQDATRNRGKAIVNSPPSIYDQEPFMVAEDDEMSKDKEIDKLMALISLSFKKIYKPSNNNLRTSSNTSRANQDNSPRINRGTGKGMSETKTGKGCSLTQGKDATVEHPKQSKSVNDTYPIEQDEHNVIIDSLDISYDGEQIDQNDDDDDLANERDLLASLIEKLKCEIDDSKNRNNFLETSNKVLVDKLKSEIEDFKNKNKSLESSNNRFKEANNKLSETNELMYNDLKKFQAELDRRNDVKYASKINDLNQTISDMKKELFAHQETISILSQAKEAQIKLYKTREDKELDNVIALENKVKVLYNIVYKTGQSVQTMNMLNRNYKMSFAKPEFLKKAQRANPRLEYYYADHMNAILGVYTELDEVTKFQPKSYEGVFLDYSQNGKAYNILNKHTRKIKESLNVTFDETPLPFKHHPWWMMTQMKKKKLRLSKRKSESDIEDETLEIDEVVNIKESRNHPLKMSKKTLTKELLDESWIIAMQEELNQFIANDIWELVPQPRNITIIGTKWVFRNKLDDNDIVSQNKARLVAQFSNEQEDIDYDETYALDSVDEDNLADPNNDLFDTIPEMFTDKHTLDYSSPPLYDDVDDDLDEFESNNDDVYNDLFYPKEDKIKESKLLINEVDPPRSSDFLPSPLV
uniref:Uncharacterized protein n=1 Tax=Tanacetum cinerariifolium TaxID=118510 RepID=A0A699GKM4_TANCI|nr:hypothetical protein [Tanacetum cinerariifolium]